MYDYSYDYSTATTGNSTGAAIFGGAMLFVWLAVVVVAVIAMWKVFVKAKQPGWAAIVPIYNFYILLKIVGRPTWWLAFLLVAIIPVVGSIALAVVGLLLAMDLAKSFGKSTTFGIVALWLFSIVGYLMLGFGDAKYLGPSVSSSAPAAKPQAPAV